MKRYKYFNHFSEFNASLLNIQLSSDAFFRFINENVKAICRGIYIFKEESFRITHILH